jgi:hypothetical protein
MLAREPSVEPPRIIGLWPHPDAAADRDHRPQSPPPSDDDPPLRDRTLPMPPIAASDVVYWHGDLF